MITLYESEASSTDQQEISYIVIGEDMVHSEEGNVSGVAGYNRSENRDQFHPGLMPWAPDPSEILPDSCQFVRDQTFSDAPDGQSC